MKYKVYVYAISKNEEKFVSRWYESVKDADGIYVLDTGSSDNTVKLLKKFGVNVITKKIDPWRFDIARNESLKLIPNEDAICICLDLDEIISPNWKEILINIWTKDVTRLRYIYNWHIDEHGNADVTFYGEKIHTRKGYKWIYPVHEILQYEKNENAISTEDIIINHYPDNSKSRSSYLKLLELSVKENPENDRNMHYLGREYMYYHKWNKSIDTLIKHLNLKSSTWIDERCASMRFIARCYVALKRYDEAHMWFEKAIKEAPHLRDPLIENALLYFNRLDYRNVYKFAKKAIKIKMHEKTYINEIFSWDYTVYDLLSLSAYYYKKDYKESLKWVKKAIKLKPNDERLLNNKNIIIEKIKNSISS